jgi:hypothetical protein
MPIYEFRNEETGEVIEREFSMNEVPSVVEEDDVEYRRYWNPSAYAINIPFQWHDGRPFKNYHKNPSEKKHYW